MKYLVIIICFIVSLNWCFAGFTDADKAQLTLNNLYNNGGAEQGIVGWSETGGGTLSIEKTIKRSGKAAIKFISSADSDFLNFPSVTVKKGTNNCESTFYYKTTGTTYKGQVYYGSDKVAEVDLSSNTEFQKKPITFTCVDVASAYTTKVTNETGTIYLDDAEIGEYKINLVTFNSRSALIADPSAITTACDESPCTVYKESGDWLLNATRAGTGDYTANINAGIFSTTPNCECTANTAGINCTIVYTSTTAIQILTKNLGDSATDSVVTLKCDDPDSIARQVVRAENANQFGALEWTQVSGCNFTAAAGNVLTDTDCNNANRKLGIAEDGTADNFELKVSNLNPGIYKISFYGPFRNTNSNGLAAVAVYDGTTTLPGMHVYTQAGEYTYQSVGIAYFDYSSFQATRTFQLKPLADSVTAYCDDTYRKCGISIEPVYPTSNMPQIVNSIYSQFMGQTRVVYGVIAADGSISKTGSGDWASTKDNTGQYHITFTPVFTSTNYSCLYNFQGNGNYGYTTVDEVSNSTASIAYYGTRNAAGAAADRPVTFTCTGNK